MKNFVIPAVIQARDLEELVRQRPGIRLLDVRTPGEYESVHIRGAYNVPLDRLGEHGAELRAQVHEPIVLICQSGQRAQRAEAALKESGMPNLHVLDGGMNAWLGSGLEVERGKKRLSLERQVRIAAGFLAALGGVLALLVNPLFALLPAFVGSGLIFAGVTDTCGMAMLLSKLSYNRPATCDVGAMVLALKNGSAPTGIGRASLHATPAATSCASPTG
jgi:rhodanese-related sulfurtransferase